MSSYSTSTDSKAHEHVVPLGVLIATWLVLLGLTVTTVVVSRMDLGQLNIYAAIGIACLKAAIVALIFMHLKYSGKFTVVVFVVSVIFAAILIGFVLFDTTQYQRDIVEYGEHPPAAAKTPAAPAAPGANAPAPTPAAADAGAP